MYLYLHSSTIHKKLRHGSNLNVPQQMSGWRRCGACIFYNRILLSHKKEWSNAICSNTDWPRDYYTKRISQTEEDKYHMVLLIHGQKGYKWTELYNRIWPTDIENKHFYQRGKGRDKLGAWGLHIYTTIYKIHAHQGPPVEHRELCWILCIKTIKEKNLKMNIHNWITVLYTWN